MLDITNLRTQRTVVELQTHCVLSSGSRDQSRPSVVPESIAILLCWDGVAITALWGRYNPGGRIMHLIYLRLSQPSENAMLNLAAATHSTKKAVAKKLWVQRHGPRFVTGWGDARRSLSRVAASVSAGAVDDGHVQEEVEVVRASLLAVREDGGRLVQPRAACTAALSGAAAPRGRPDLSVAPWSPGPPPRHPRASASPTSSRTGSALRGLRRPAP